MIHTKKIITVAVISVLAGNVYAQQNKEGEQDLSRELTLEREYDPTVQDANKVNTLPAVKEPEVKRTAIEYASYSIPADPAKEINVLPSGNVMTDILYNNKKGYFNFGIGTYTNVNGDIGYHILNTPEDKLNVFFSHRSTNGNVKYLETAEKVKAKLNDNLGGINYRHSFSAADLKIGARYGYTAFNYYGENLLSHSTPDIDTYQGNQQIGLNAGVASRKDATFGYLFDLDYTNFSQRYGRTADEDGLTENSIGIKGGVNTLLNNDNKIGLDAKVDIFTYSLPAGLEEFKNNYAEITASPYYKIIGDNFDVKFGANLMYVTGDESKFFVSPNIGAQIEFVDKTVLYFDASGRVESNSAYNISQFNRYISPGIPTYSSRTWLDAVLGIKSGIVPGFWFDVFAGYKITDNDLFFVQQPPLYGGDWGNVSSPFYMDSKVFKGGVELKYAYQKFFDIYMKTVYNNWKVDGDREAYGKPQLEFSAGLNISPIEQMNFSLDYQLASGRYGWNFGSEDKMKNINELNLFVNYNLNDVIGVYVKGNNLLNQKYELLPGYPVQGISAMVGVNFNF